MGHCSARLARQAGWWGLACSVEVCLGPVWRGRQGAAECGWDRSGEEWLVEAGGDWQVVEVRGEEWQGRARRGRLGVARRVKAKQGKA